MGNGEPSGSGSRRHRRRDDDVPSDDTSDSDFVVDSEDEVEEDGAIAPAPPVPVVVPPPPLRRKEKGRKKKKAKGDEDKPPLPWQEWEGANKKWLDERVGEGEVGEASAAVVPTAEPAPEVVLRLLRFQKEWLAWALAQEASVSRGGILADEMGMGKTIQGISLVLTARRLRPPGPPPPSAAPSLLLGPPMRRVGCTLVICPVVAVIQWGGKKGKGRSGYKRKSGVEEEDYEELDEELGSQSRGQSPLHSVRWERIILDEICISTCQYSWSRGERRWTRSAPSCPTRPSAASIRPGS